MNGYQDTLYELLLQTEKLLLQAKAIHSKMEDNEDGQLEELQQLIEERELIIQKLDSFIQQPGFTWSEEDKETINKLKEYDQKLHSLLNQLYQSFLTQINRLNQTKQASKKYGGAYQSMTSNGSFFDTRK